MLTQQDIINFCNKYNYDIRSSGNARWIDQKCAPDVVTIIADCIYNYAIENKTSIFTTSDIWHYKYSVENVEAIFKKPSVKNKEAKHEYDKFFQQPMEMLANAHVLTKNKSGNHNVYSISNMYVLEYIALREKNALYFLKTYIQKVLTDSGLHQIFDDFFKIQTTEAYNNLKRTFSTYMMRYTKINNNVECNRIFIKVLNPLAYFFNSRGTERGRISTQNITYDMLMYNRNNFRDIYAKKPKGMTRKEYALTHNVIVNNAYYRYQSTKAKKFLRLFNDKNRNGMTEHIEDAHLNDKAIHMHHIFPEAKYPEISFYLENIIALTPTQHLNYAHTDGHTQEINEQYQHLLLLSKADSICNNLNDDTVEHIYEFSNFLFVLTIGFDNDDILEIDNMDFTSVINKINAQYIV